MAFGEPGGDTEALTDHWSKVFETGAPQNYQQIRSLFSINWVCHILVLWRRAGPDECL